MVFAQTSLASVVIFVLLKATYLECIYRVEKSKNYFQQPDDQMSRLT